MWGMVTVTCTCAALFRTMINQMQAKDVILPGEAGGTWWGGL